MMWRTKRSERAPSGASACRKLRRAKQRSGFRVQGSRVALICHCSKIVVDFLGDMLNLHGPSRHSQRRAAALA